MNSHRRLASGKTENETKIKSGSQRNREEAKALETPWPVAAGGGDVGNEAHLRAKLQPSRFAITVKGDPVRLAEVRTSR